MTEVNQSLADLVTKKKITLKLAVELSNDPAELEKIIAQRQGAVRAKVV